MSYFTKQGKIWSRIKKSAGYYKLDLDKELTWKQFLKRNKSKYSNTKYIRYRVREKNERLDIFT